MCEMSLFKGLREKARDGLRRGHRIWAGLKQDLDLQKWSQ